MEFFLAIIAALLLGIFSGFIVGMLPGISASFVLIISVPFLYGQDILTILIFYLAVMSASQYSESIVALMVGLPGESTSLPAVSLRENFLSKTAMRQAMYNCATGSLIGSLFAVAISLFVIDLVKDSVVYLKTIFMVGLGVAALLLCIASSTNRWYESLLLIVAGWYLSKIGYDQVSNTHFFTFNNPYLMGGLPFVSVTVSLFVIPVLIKTFLLLRSPQKTTLMVMGKINWLNKRDLIYPSIRGSIVGYFLGLIPYVGSYICSNVAHFIEQKLKSNPLSQLTAAETANNAAWFSVTVPMLLFGIAIVPSESIILEILNVNGQSLNWKVLENILPKLALAMVVINLICWVLSFYSVNNVIKLLSIPPKITMAFISLITLASVFYVGSQITQGWYYIIVLLILAPIGILLYRKDTMPLIFAFLLQNVLDSAVLRLQQLYL